MPPRLSQAFIRCPHCNLPHAVGLSVCPTTGKAIDRSSSRRLSEAPAQPSSSAPPAASTSSAPPPSPDPADRRGLVGTTIDGKYAVRSVLGQGGMAIVYEAEQLVMGRAVALKVLPSDQADRQDAAKRFLQEARAAASLSHPNVCQIFDFGALPDGSPYFVMERLVGEPLSERFARERGLAFLDAVEICLQVLAALGSAHQKAIIHRDIKPDNVFLVRRDPRPPLVKLLDFGVAKIVLPRGETTDETTQLTRAGQVMGTPYYMAPEQAFGDRDLDPRVDLWATGCILYQAITGRKPFTAPSYAGIMNAILTEAPKPLRELRPGTPPELEPVIAKALAKQRDDRYPNAVAFMRDLHKMRVLLFKRGLVPEAMRRGK